MATTFSHGLVAVTADTFTKLGTGNESAEDIARFAIWAAADFDDSTGLPVASHTIKLKRR